MLHPHITWLQEQDGSLMTVNEMMDGWLDLWIDRIELFNLQQGDCNTVLQKYSPIDLLKYSTTVSRLPLSLLQCINLKLDFSRFIHLVWFVV